MKKVEIKKWDIGSVVKVVFYMMLIPAAICILIGIIMALVGVFVGSFETILMGIFVGIGYPIILLGVYALSSSLESLIYNFCAGKFGGLEMYIEEREDC